MLDALVALGLATTLALGLLPLVAGGATRVRRAREDTASVLAALSRLDQWRSGLAPATDGDCLGAGAGVGACAEWTDAEGRGPVARGHASLVRRWRVSRHPDGTAHVVVCARPLHDDLPPSPAGPVADGAPCVAALLGRPGGFTLAELLVAAGVLAIAAALLAPALQVAGARLEADTAAAELSQRLRAGALGLREVVDGAGGGAWLGSGTALARLPALWPGWPGPGGPAEASAAGGETAAFTALAGRWNGAEARLPGGAPEGARVLVPQPATADGGVCPSALPACGFAAGDTVLITDAAGTVAVADLQRVDVPLALVLAQPLGVAVGPDAMVVQVEVVRFALRPDGDAWLLVRASGTSAPQPWIDHVTAFAVTWWTGSGAAAAVAPGALADGPWVPSAEASGRWDADLRHVRAVGVRLALRAAAAGMRWGVALPGRPASAQVPDLATTLVLAPRRDAAVMP